MRQEDWWFVSLLSFFLLFIFGVIWLVMYADKRDKARQIEAGHICSVHGLASANLTEQHGKSSISVEFCYDKDGRVYWVEGLH